ncbi:CPBP family intramembrane glutamic endopeptidase [Glaciibacter psychrotolerans]|uniref:CAAX prenyl protease 2/Lysostaphin resistance protein A-like domain-containing protein n=1 Tax=Glaciibacter psychrotolerans TaxID=670054 RepID=A0A7Z0J5R8_9MICO|nr:hypothetical protein [Leifsonia psychrotolerans]
MTYGPEATKKRTYLEIAIVLGLSLGASAVYSIISIIARLTEPIPLASQTATLNGSQSTREWLDFTYQLLGSFFGLMPVALVLYLLWRPGQNVFRSLGFDFTRPGKDLLGGLTLLVVIGVPGLGLYLAGRAFGFTVAVDASPLETYWWTIPILIFAALQAALLEELIVIGYLFTRLMQLGWSRWTIILSAAALRGSYHLYQGIGPFFGNFAMGVVFGWAYTRWGRVMPLVIAHWILDIASFVGYPLALAWWPDLLAPTPTSTGTPTPTPTP